MENSRKARRGLVWRWVLMAVLVAVPTALWAGKPKVLDTSRYPRVAVLVCRMAGQNGMLSEIQPETDYSLRVLGKKTDVCGEDEERLRAAFASYPLFIAMHTPKIETRFFGNLTQPITSVLVSVLREKGRTVLDVREQATAWPKPLSEMALKGILAGLGGQADALLVLHYIDGGDSFYDCVKFRRVDKGFSSLQCKLALFDVSTGQRVAQVEMGFNPMAVMAVDPAILNNPEGKGKIRVVDPAAKDYSFDRGFFVSERQGVFFTRGSATVFQFTDTEVQTYAMGYLRNGFKDSRHLQDVPGLNTLIQ
jgi:hypothetical protein